MGEIRIKSGNLANGELEQGGISVSGDIVTSSARVYGYAYVKSQTAYTIASNKAFRLCYGYSDDGTSISKVGRIFDNNSGNNKLTTFTTPEGCNYIRFAMWNGDESDIIPTDIQNLILVEGTYTSSTIPEYQPYFLNRPAHQFTNGQCIDIPTHHFINGRWQGELTSQSPLKFRADGEMLDWRVEGKTSGNLVESFRTTENTAKFSICLLGMLDIKPSTSYTISFIMEKGVKAFFNEYLFVYEHFTGTGQRQVFNITTNADIDKNASTWVTEYGWILCKNWVNNKNACNFREVMILEGTYTSETIPPYEPYGGVGDWDETTQRYKIPVTVNGTTTNIYTDHQLMGGDSIDYTTDQTAIPIATGNNTLTVDTAVQPSKVFVKFEG